jgi:hypothetical protein
MEKLTISERVFIVKNYYELNSSPVKVQRAWSKEYPGKNPPSDSTIIR